MKELSDKYDKIQGGKNFIKYVNNVQHALEEKEYKKHQQNTLEMVNGVLQCLERKINDKQQEELITQRQFEHDEAYQQKIHLIKMKEDMLRKINFKKAQKSNLKKLTENKEYTRNDMEKKVDEALVAKVGIANKTKE